MADQLSELCGDMGTLLTSTTWFAANLAFFIPVRFTREEVIRKFYWMNGATVSGNVDCGLYAPDGTKIVSTGSTAQSGTTAIQIVDTTDTVVGPGLFYLALACDNTTAAFGMASSFTNPMIQILGCAEVATSFILPATVTLGSTSRTSIPHCGCSLESGVI